MEKAVSTMLLCVTGLLALKGAGYSIDSEWIGALVLFGGFYVIRTTGGE